MSENLALDCWFLTGPTAAGKSAVGVELAERIDAEIISMDSMTLYRGMDIGTAKPLGIKLWHSGKGTEVVVEGKQAILRDCWRQPPPSPSVPRVPHHLIDIFDPKEECSLAQYIEMANRAAAEIAGRGRKTLFVGGTPLYLKGLLRGIFQGPPADWHLRRRLAEQARQHGGMWLHQRLIEVDPTAAAKLHPNDARRLIRALEVFEKTGRPISELQRQFDIGRPASECRVFVLDWPKAELHARIQRRVEEMFAAGLVEEVRGLLSLSRTARQAVGYREVIEHLEGRRNLTETIELVVQHTRQLAKRQGTWFRSLSECRFVSVGEPFHADQIAERILKSVN